MVFIGFVFLAIVLYILDFKIPALLLFFFFITSGFNLVPEEITKFAFISKGSDYAFFILVGIIAIDGLLNREYFKRDDFTKYLLLFASFLIICIFYSKYVVGLGWGDILRTSRYQFFWMAYFLFRHTAKDKLETLLKCLFFVTLCTAFLFLLQIFIDKNILLETETGYTRLFGMKIPRYYNQPDMLFFFTYMALYHNPLKGISKYASMVIFTAALLGAFHRSLLGFFFISIFIGYAIMLPYIKRVYLLTIFAALSLFAVVFLGNRFVHSRTYLDVQSVLSGNFAEVDFDMEDLGNNTFTFRILHLLERNQFLIDHPRARFLGAGLIPEDSKLVEKMFDFKMGLAEELTGTAVQLESGDISYSVLFIRLGYLGTGLYLLLYIYFMIFFYKKRENRYAFFSFLYLILTIGVSFFAANLLNPVTFLLPVISYLIIKKTDLQVAINENGK